MSTCLHCSTPLKSHQENFCCRGCESVYQIIHDAGHEMFYDLKADTPLTFYAATKKANESMAHSYAHLWKIPTTMFRFFTVYGPWGRPDMAPYIFTKKRITNFSKK